MERFSQGQRQRGPLATRTDVTKRLPSIEENIVLVGLNLTLDKEG
jgi:hypothetical protein